MTSNDAPFSNFVQINYLIKLFPILRTWQPFQAMANQYQDLFNSSGAWATYYAKEFAGPQHFQNRSKTETLYLWQNANVTERCHIQFREHPNDPRM